MFWTCNRSEFPQHKNNAPFLQMTSDWADSLLLEMTLEEKIGQLIFVRSDMQAEGRVDSLLKWAWNGNIGGLILENLPLSEYVQLFDTLQFLSRIPLLNGTPQSVLLNNQFSDLHPFPLPATMAAMSSDSLEKEIAELYLQQCKALNMHFALAPNLGTASLADTAYDFQYWEGAPSRLNSRSVRMLKRLQNRGVMAVANTFDDLIYLERDTTYYVDSVLQKYQNLIQKGLSGLVLDQNLFLEEAVEKRQEGFVASYLSERIDFDGLLFGEISSTATLEKLLYAGTDVFLVKDKVNEHIQSIQQLVKEDLLSEKRLNESVYKVLMAKAWSVDSLALKVDDQNFANDFYNKRFEYYVSSLHERAINLPVNYQQTIPFAGPFSKKFRLVHVGADHLKTFNQQFEQYAEFRSVLIRPDKKGKLKALDEAMYKWHPTVVTLNELNLDAKKHRSFIASLNKLSRKTKLVCVNYGNPLNLQHLDTTLTTVQVFERNKATEKMVPQLLFGGIRAKGKLPMAIAEHLPFGQQIVTPQTRLKYTEPQEVGIAPHKLVGIDALVKNAIESGTAPGAQVMVVKSGKVIYQKSFGYHTYDKKQAIKNDHLYDIASITKVASTTLGLMKLYEQEKFKLNDKLSKHLPFLDNKSLEKLTLKRLLIHQSGLQANMPIASYILYKDTLDNDCNPYFCKNPMIDYEVKIADSLFMHHQWVDSLWQDVYDLKPRRRKRFRYSDVNFNLLQKVLEESTKLPLDEFVNQQFYEPLSLHHCTYQPLNDFSPNDLVPTANDERWRKQLLRGFVHDESAALMGGVGGNAGLFSNTNDLATIAQMLLNGGTYGGNSFLKQSTIDLFTTAKHGNHRGLGFDLRQKRKPISCSDKASKQTFGHSGFTGTCMWIDPKEELVFIFLTNRIYPDVRNRRIFKSKLRSRIHTLIYKALDTFDGALFSDEVEPEVKKAKIDF